MSTDNNIKLRCVVIDDEPLASGLVTDYIERIPFLQLIGVYHNPLSALSALKNEVYNLVFLDIRMPELSGLKLSELLNNNCKIIFTTAYPVYAVQGYELNAIDYLVKPFTFERFLKAVNKVLEMIHFNDQSVSVTGNVSSLSYPEEVLFVRTDRQIVKIFLSEILFIEGLKEYITIHTLSKKVITLQNLKRMEEVLPKNRFVRVHKSFIIAIDKIDTVSKNRINIKNNYIPVGDTFKDSFFSLLNDKNML